MAPTYVCEVASCDRQFPTARGLAQHVRLTHRRRPDVQVEVNRPLVSCPHCERTFASANGLRVHQRWRHPLPLAAPESAEGASAAAPHVLALAPAPAADDPDSDTSRAAREDGAHMERRVVPSPHLCPVADCLRVFATRIGLGQHLRRAHPNEANAEVEVDRLRARWSEEERQRLAVREAELTMEGFHFLNQELMQAFPHRTLEAIKCHRRSQEHRQRVAAALGVLRQRLQPPEDDFPSRASVGEEVPDRRSDGDLICGTLDELACLLGQDVRQTTLAGIVLLARRGEVFLPSLETFLKDLYPVQSRSHGYHRPPVPRRLTRRQRRRADYARIQDLYRKSRSQCAKELLDGRPDLNFGDPVTFLDFWQRTMAPGPPDLSDPEGDLHCPPRSDVVRPVTVEEVKRAIPRSPTAPGPDGVPLRAVARTPDVILAIVFNLFLLAGDVPSYLKEARVVFIPKTTRPANPGDYRPISVSSVLLRVYHRILACRLQDAVPMDVRQRAFMPVDGCCENITLLSSIIAEGKRKCRSAYIATLDLRKAFDTVSFGAVLGAGRRVGLPPRFLSYLERLYSGSTAKFSVSQFGRITPVTQGVRQGDPLSPCLFNYVIDGLLAVLPNHIGVNVGSESCNAMAFADDLVLLASTPGGLQDLLNTATVYLGERGLSFNIEKCHTLALVASGHQKKIKVQNVVFHLGGEQIPTVGLNSSWRYLGLYFDSSGLRRVSIHQDLRKYLDNLTRAPLKPQQRLFILRQFLLPRLLHGLVLGRTSATLLKDLDITVRAAIRRWLRLPVDCPIAFYHAAVCDGGLGVMSLRTAIPRLTLSRLSRLQDSTSPACAAAAATPAIRRRIGWARRSATVDGRFLGSAASCITYWGRQLRGTVDGRGLAEAPRVPAAHAWVSDGSALLPGADFIEAIKVRANAVPTRSRCSRGRPLDRTCRAGCRATETLAHVAQHCATTYISRHRRHDNIAIYLATRLRSLGWHVQRERHIMTSNGLRKPDIVASRDDVTAVIDVQVVGCGRPLQELHQAKASKYATEEITEILLRGAGGSTIFTSATINYRGVWAEGSAGALQDLGITKSDLKLVAVKTVQGTISAWKFFCKATARVHGPAV